MPVPLPGPNAVLYVLIGGAEYRRVYSGDGLTAVDTPVDATIMATPEYATYHASQEAVPLATDDATFEDVVDPPDATDTSTDDGV